MKISVSKQFAEDFDVVANHYGLRESGEYDAVKKDTKQRMAVMGEWVTREAAWIKAGCPIEITNKWGRVIEVLSA